MHSPRMYTAGLQAGSMHGKPVRARKQDKMPDGWITEISPTAGYAQPEKKCQVVPMRMYTPQL